jgi:HEAT repeat protein
LNRKPSALPAVQGQARDGRESLDMKSHLIRAVVLVLATSVTSAAVAPSAPACCAAASADTATPTALSLPDLFSVMLRSQGEEYVSARDEMLRREPEAADVLKSKLADPDWHVRIIAEAALDRMSRPQAYDQYAANIAYAVTTASHMRPGAFRGLTALFMGRRPSAIGRPLKSLDSISAVPFLIEVLVKGSWRPTLEQRPATASQTPAATRLRESLVQEHAQVGQCLAALCLGALNDPRAVEPLVEMTVAGEFPWLRAKSASALGWTGRAQAVAPLLKALGDEAPEVRASAAGALGEILTAPAEPLTRAASSDPDAQVRWAANDALRRIADRAREKAKAESR